MFIPILHNQKGSNMTICKFPKMLVPPNHPSQDELDKFMIESYDVDKPLFSSLVQIRRLKCISVSYPCQQKSFIMGISQSR